MINRSSLFAALLAASGAMAAPAVSLGATNIDIEVAPPPARVEMVPPPRHGYVWAPGHWQWRGRGHVWVPGRWVRERRGYHWVPDHWEQTGRHWHYFPGHWDR